MARRTYELVTHSFKGGRFRDHGLDIDVLPDLVAYKTLLVETAKELWRRNHPDRQRLPKNFEDSLTLKFYEVGRGSVSVPLMREVESEQTLFAPPQDELDEAVELIAEAISAASSDRALPEALPKSIVPLFADYGRTLRPDESFEIRPARRIAVVRYTCREREQLVRLCERGYMDVVDLRGEIRAADLDGGNFALRVPDGSKILGKFLPEQESLITDALKEHQTRHLHITGQAEFLPDGRIKRIVSAERLDVQLPGPERYDTTARPVWEVVAEIGASVPDREWARVPADLSKNVDHYLYGAAREEE